MAAYFISNSLVKYKHFVNDIMSVESISIMKNIRGECILHLFPIFAFLYLVENTGQYRLLGLKKKKNRGVKSLVLEIYTFLILNGILQMVKCVR